VIDRSKVGNSFEFITTASARAKQLLKGARPRVAAEGKTATVAMREVLAGEVKKLDPVDPVTTPRQG
jgi:DNA-directed RNA polymerase subunit K/omega